MRIIAVATLKTFWNQPGHRDAEMPLRTWVGSVKAANWSKPNEVKEVFGTADLLADGRVVFNIGGNKYRLVTAIHYRGKRIYVRFIGTHKEYDKIDANEV